MYLPRFKKSAFGVALIVGASLFAIACSGGDVSQDELDAVQAQLQAKQSEIASLQEQVSLASADVSSGNVPLAELETARRVLQDKETELAGLEVSLASLTSVRGELDQALTDLDVTEAELALFTLPFEEWRQTFERRAETGSLKFDHQIKVLKTYEANGPRVINPSPGDVLVYVNTGTQNWGVTTRANEENTNEYSRVNVINATTKEFLGSAEMVDAPGRVHSSAVSSDGRYVYVPAGRNETAVLFKVDALTLEPLKMLDVGGTIHHMQVFQKYLMIDTFNMAEGTGSEGRATMLLDTDTDQIIGAISSDKMGGNQYTAWGGPNEEYIYFLMEPEGHSGSRDFGAGVLGGGVYWVAKVDPETWEVVREYPYPGQRSDWIQFDPTGKFMYVNGSTDDSVMKIDLDTGGLVWRAPTGIGPYGIEVNVDGTEVWVADKGESWKRHAGRTITVRDAEEGEYVNTIMHDGRGTDHIVLSPNGKEMWATANDSGTVFVIDATTQLNIAEIPMPLFGDPHGVVFVAYDSDGNASVVADQGDFHNGIDPRNGRPFNY